MALSGGTPEFRVLQQLEPADDLCATLFCLHRLAWRLAIEEGKRVIEGTPVVIIQVGVSFSRRSVKLFQDTPAKRVKSGRCWIDWLGGAVEVALIGWRLRVVNS